MAKLLILWDISDAVAGIEFLLVTSKNPSVTLVPKDVLYAGVRPEVLPNILCMLTVELGLKLRGRPSQFRVQQAGDRHEPHAAETQLVDTADSVCGLWYHLDVARVFVLPVTERRDDDQPLLLLLPIPCTDLFTNILCVVIIHQTANTDDKIVIFF